MRIGIKMNFDHKKNVPVAIDRNSCPLSCVSVSRAIADVTGMSENEFKLCEMTICNQINRKISKDECVKILSECGANVSAATLVDDVLNAFDTHVPSISKQATPSSVNKRCRLWTYEEDCLLLAGLHKFGLGDWKSIAFYVGGGRSRSQCSQRWGRALDPKIAKVPWTAEEEGTLLSLVSEHGEHAWATISKKLGSRSDVQCRYRYFQIKKMNHRGESDPSSEDDTKVLPQVSVRSVKSLMNNYKRATCCPKDSLFGFLNNEELFKGPLDRLIPPLRPKIEILQKSSEIYLNVC